MEVRWSSTSICLSRVENEALVFQRQVPTIQTVQKTVEVSGDSAFGWSGRCDSCVAKPSTNHPDSTEDDGGSGDSVS